MALKLTCTEQNILEHRLGVPDAVANVLTDSYDYLDYDDIVDECEFLLIHLDLWHEVPEDPAELAKLILEDCIINSTWIAAISEASEATIGHHLVVGRKLAERMSKHLGTTLVFPEY